MSTIPHDIRLIAAVSRLLDFHQSRREAGGSYVPVIPDSAGQNLHLALSVIEALHEIEMDRGVGYIPIVELADKVRLSLPDIGADDIEFCITNLKHPREIRYRAQDENGQFVESQTWDTTPLLEAQEGISQVRLSENARLLLRITSLRESWLYSDVDADRLVKVIERNQFQDIPTFCRSMVLDITTKRAQLAAALERPSRSELRTLLITEGDGIASSLHEAASTATKAITLIYEDHTAARYEQWLATPSGAVFARDGVSIGNLQADMKIVLQNIEALSRRFSEFIELAQTVRHEGIEPVPFLEIADHLVKTGNETTIERVESLMLGFLPWGKDDKVFHPSMLVGAADLSVKNEDEPAEKHTFQLDTSIPQATSRFSEFLSRNRDVVIERLAKGPALFSEIISLGNFVLEPGDSVMDFYGVYVNPRRLEEDGTRIIVGITNGEHNFSVDGDEYVGTDPVMYMENINDTD